MNSKTLVKIALLAAVMLPAAAFGNIIHFVSIDTSPLMISPSGPFSLDFQFIDGSGIGDSNNSVTVDNFNFGTGAPVGVPFVFGSVIGDLSTGIAFTDAEFFNAFNQTFTPGAVLGFTVTMTTNPESIDVPDQFSFAILDGNGFGSPMLIAEVGLGRPTMLAFASDALSLDAPTVNSVPEPSFGWLVGACCLALGLVARSRSAARKQLASGHAGTRTH